MDLLELVAPIMSRKLNSRGYLLPSAYTCCLYRSGLSRAEMKRLNPFADSFSLLVYLHDIRQRQIEKSTFPLLNLEIFLTTPAIVTFREISDTDLPALSPALIRPVEEGKIIRGIRVRSQTLRTASEL